MDFPFKSILKKRGKKKKRAVKQLDIGKTTKERIQELKQEISADPKKDHLTDFSKIIRYFFMKLFKIKYYFTNEEFAEELKRKRVSDKLKSDIIQFFQELSDMEFKQDGYDIKDLQKQIKKFEAIMPNLLDEKKVKKPQSKKGFFNKLLLKFGIRRKIAEPGAQGLKLRKFPHPTKFRQAITAIEPRLRYTFAFKWLKRKPQDNLIKIYGLIAQCYDAIGKKNIKKAGLRLSKIESIFSTLSIGQANLVKKEISTLRKDFNAIKPKPKLPSEPIQPKLEPVKKKPIKDKKFKLPSLKILDHVLVERKLSELPVPPKPEVKLEPEKKIQIPIEPLQEILERQPKSRKPSFFKSLFKPKKKKGSLPILDLSTPKVETKTIPEPFLEKTEPEEEVVITKRPIKKLGKEMKYVTPKPPFTLDQPEIGYHPQKPVFQSDKPTVQDISSLKLESIQKSGRSFRPKQIFIRSYEPKTVDTKTAIKKLEKVTSKPIAVKPTIPLGKKTQELGLKIEDLENLIQTAQYLLKRKNYPAAMQTYSKALELKKSMKLEKQDAERISYDLQGIDVDLKLSSMT